MERILGPQMGDFVRSLHEECGVAFHLEDTASAIEGRQVKLKSSDTLEADLVVVGIGVRPRVELAESAGLTIDRGVVVNAYLETNAPGIFAAGDIARWPDPPQRREQSRRALGGCRAPGANRGAQHARVPREIYRRPFFWSQHYDIPINYLGHAEKWDDLAIEGDIAGKECLLRFRRDGRTLAVASIFRDIENLQAEVVMERQVPD